MTLRIGTSDLGGTFYSQGAAIAGLLNRTRSKQEQCVVDITPGSIDNANRLDRGEIEFGFMASNWIERARNGVAPFTKKIALRMVSPANAGPIFFVTLADSPIRTVADLRGRRVAVGGFGSGMVQHVHTMFNALAIPFTTITPVYLGFAEGADALIAREVDAQFQCPIPNQVMTDLSEGADIRVVPYGSGQLDKLLSQVPFYRKVTMEKGAFRGLTEDVSQAAVVNVIVTHENVKEEPVRDMAKTLAENLDALPELNPLFKGLKEFFEPLRTRGSAAFEFGGVALHPGAIRAYRESGWLK